MINIKEVADNVFMLKIPVPINVDAVNLYLFAGEIPTLLDAGTNTPEVLEAVHAGMKKVGIKKLEQVLISHWHVDHAGAANTLAQEGARVFAGSRDYQEWISFVQGEAFTRLNEWATREWGVPENVIPGMLKISKRLQTFTALPDQVNLLEPYQIIQAGNSLLQVIPTPGHTAGHLSFYAAKDSVLFSGDMLLPDEIPYPGIWEDEGIVVSGMPSYLESLNRIENLPSKVYLPGHGLPSANLKARCQEIRGKLNKQMLRHSPAESVYASASSLGGEAIHPGLLFIQLHYVYGWEQLKKKVG